MDFVSVLKHTSRGSNSIWANVDRFTKLEHFIPFYMYFSVERLACIYVHKIVYLDGVPISII